MVAMAKTEAASVISEARKDGLMSDFLRQSWRATGCELLTRITNQFLVR